MGWLRFFRRAKWDAERTRELESYLQIETDENIARGMPPQEARDTAHRKLGNTTRIREEIYRMNTAGFLDTLVRDALYALRTLRHNPTFTFAALLTLAIGIGANTAVFSVINSVLLKPLRYPEPDELVAVWHKAPGAPGLTDVSGDLRLSPSMYFTYAERNRTFQSIGVWITRSATVTGRADPEQVRVLGVSDGALQALAVRPALGRWLTNADQTPGGAEVVMLSHGYWRRRFGGDQSAIGRSIVIDSQPREVVGVMPEGFRFVNADFDVILPMRFDRSRVILPGFGFQAVARLKAGVTIPEASADVARMVPIWMTSWPAAPTVNPRIYESWRIAPALRPLKQDVIQNVGSVLWVVMGTVGIVMLIACANVANLLLVRAEGRQHELAIRAALGAGRTRIIGGLLIESVLLGVAGGVLGLALAYASLRFLLAAEPANLPRLTEISVDGRTLSFIVAVSLLSGISFGLIPALKQAGSHAGLALRSAGRTSSQSRERHRTRNLLVVTQVALAVVLLVSSALMIRTFQALRRVEPGFTNPPQLQTMRISIPASLVAEPERVARLQNELVEKFAAIPGVTSAGFGSAMPMEGFPPFNWDAIRVEGREGLATETPPLRLFKNVSPGFFQTAGMRLIAGRDYTWTDLYDLRRVVMVSENLARELWGKPSDAVGKRIRTIPGAPLHEIIAVVEDVRENGLHESAPTIVYWPAYGPTPYLTGQNVTRTATFVVRSERAGTEAFLNQVRQAVLSVNAGLAIASVRTMQEVYDLSMAGRPSRS